MPDSIAGRYAFFAHAEDCCDTRYSVTVTFQCAADVVDITHAGRPEVVSSLRARLAVRD